VPEDRQRDGLVMEMTLAENMILKSSYDAQWKTGPFLKLKRINDYTNAAIEEYSIKAPGPYAKAKSLSGVISKIARCARNRHW